MQRESLWVAGVKAVVGTVVATLAVRWVAVATLDIPVDFQPLDGPGPVIFFTTVASIGAVAAYAIVRRVALRPDFAFRVVAGVVLVLSIMPDLWLLSDGAEEVFPGATPTAVTVLIVLHVVAAISIVGFLTSGGEDVLDGEAAVEP